MTLLHTGPVVTTHPTSATVPLNSNVTFTCAGYRYIAWHVNGLQLLSNMAQSFFNDSGIFGAIEDQNFSQLFVFASIENNNTQISCIFRTGPNEIANVESQIAHLYVYGKLIQKIETSVNCMFTAFNFPNSNC